MTYPVRIPGQAGSWAQSPTQTPPPTQPTIAQTPQTSVGAQRPASYSGHRADTPEFALSEGSFGFRQKLPEPQDMSAYLATPNRISTADWSDYDTNFAEPEPTPEPEAQAEPPAPTPPPDPARHYEADEPSFMSPTEEEIQYGQDQGLFVGGAEPEGGFAPGGEIDTTGDGVPDANTFTQEGEDSILDTLLTADNPDGTVGTGRQRELGLGTTETGQYEDTQDDRHRAAADFGYEQGTNTGAALGTAAGALLGVPGLGLLGGELAGDTAGDLGTTDAQGNVYDEDGNRFNPVTGEQTQSIVEQLNPFDDGAEYESVGEGATAVPAASQAGLRSVAGEDSILAALNEAETPPLPADQMSREALDAISWSDATPEQYAQKQINAWLETAPPEQMLGTQDGRVVYDGQVFDNVQAAEDHRRQQNQVNVPEPTPAPTPVNQAPHPGIQPAPPPVEQAPPVIDTSEVDQYFADDANLIWGNSGWTAERLAQADEGTREAALSGARGRYEQEQNRLATENRFTDLQSSGRHDFQEGMTAEQFSRLPPAFQNNILRDAEIRATTRRRSEADAIDGVNYDAQSGQFTDAQGNQYNDAQQANQANIEFERFQREQARVQAEAAERERAAEAERQRIASQTYTSASGNTYTGQQAINKRAADEEARRQTGTNVSAVTDSSGRAVRDRNNRVVTSTPPQRDSGGDSGGGGGK